MRRYFWLLAALSVWSCSDGASVMAADVAPAPAPADPHITINLPASQWNVILQALGAQPYQTVQSLIAEMQKQAAPQIPAAPTDKKADKK